uniref:Phospholipid/glycerol acyltransferase domain-containing protein n=1 Tax=Panagrolaimus sp. JU765 TaxID=591449 RepID=A0AC34RB11_9BILA
MFHQIGYFLYYLICFIIILVLILSVTGKSTGIREKCADFLLVLFEWAATQTVDENLESELEGEEDDSETLNEDEAAAIPRKRRRASGDQPLIARQWSNVIENKLSSRGSESSLESENLQEPVQKNSTVKILVNDTLEFVTAGVESIIEDRVTNRFKAAEITSWNFLSRNKDVYVYINWKLTVIWVLGVIFRYCCLFPVRLLLFTVAILTMLITTTIIGYVPNRALRKRLNRSAMLMCFRIFSRAFSSIIRFHDKQNKATGGGICVANHTSPIDVMILSTDNVYSMIGQRQGGFLGFLQTSLSRSEHHLWFERSETKDRQQVAKSLQEHVDDPTKLPILIFPEGTCINNTSVMLFKKGSFEIASTIYPIAMRYDNRLGDAFWNSHETGYFAYLMSMMTSWALICDVWYLPPVTRGEDETAIDFAKRVQKMIAKKGGLIDLEWDGNLKRSFVPQRLKEEQKEAFYNYLTRTTSICSCKPPNEEKLKKLIEGGLPEVFDETDNEHDQNAEKDGCHDSGHSSPEEGSQVQSAKKRVARKV